MPRRRQPLPEYSTLIRWTVQEVINWLAENSLSDCSKCFREGGVDGNKLVNIIDTDLVNIKCPRKYIKEILSHVETVSKPGGPPRSGGHGNRGNNQRQVPFNDVNHVQDDGSDDDGCWDDEEFSDYDDENDSGGTFDEPAPVAPPRPNRREVPALPRAVALPPASQRRLPPPCELEQEEVYEDPDNPVPPEVKGPPPIPGGRGRPPLPVPSEDSPDEDYEDPDANMKVQNFHAGPLPKLPTAKPKTVPVGQRKPPPVLVSMASQDSFSEPDEEYEDPDSTVSAKGPPIPPGPRRPPPPPEPSEVYEDPDVTIPPQKPSAQRRPPPPPVSSVPTTHSVRRKAPEPEELPSYEMPDNESTPPPVPRNVPKRKPSEPKVQEPEETYEVPDETDSAPARSASQNYQKTVPIQEEETYEVPDHEEAEEQDDYLDMDQEQIEPQNVQTLAFGGSKNKPGKAPRGKMPLPNEPKSTPGKALPERKVALEEQETYEIPEEETIKVPQKKKIGVQVLPGLPGLKVTNGMTENSSPVPLRPGRALPPPPAVSHEKVEPVKKEPVKPVTSTSQPKEMTEADLLRQKWYHGNIKRVDAELKLKQLNIDGMYLIRKSTQGNNQPYTLQIFYKSQVYNLPIRRRIDNLFAVGKEEKENERAFVSLLDLVNAFKQNILLLAGGAETKLVKSLPKT